MTRQLEELNNEIARLNARIHRHRSIMRALLALAALMTIANGIVIWRTHQRILRSFEKIEQYQAITLARIAFYEAWQSGTVASNATVDVCVDTATGMAWVKPMDSCGAAMTIHFEGLNMAQPIVISTNNGAP